MVKDLQAVSSKIKFIRNRIKQVNNKVDAFEDKLVDAAKYRIKMVHLYKIEHELSKKYEVINKSLKVELGKLTVDYNNLSEKIKDSPSVNINGKEINQKKIYDYMFPKAIQSQIYVDDNILKIFQEKFNEEYLEVLKLNTYLERKNKLEAHLFKGMGGNLPETQELDKTTLTLLKELHKTARIKEDKLQVITDVLKQDFMSALSKNPSLGMKIADYKPEIKFDEFFGEMIDVGYNKSKDFLIEASWEFSKNISKRFPKLKKDLKDVEDCMHFDNPNATAEYSSDFGSISYYKDTH